MHLREPFTRVSCCFVIVKTQICSQLSFPRATKFGVPSSRSFDDVPPLNTKGLSAVPCFVQLFQRQPSPPPLFQQQPSPPPLFQQRLFRGRFFSGGFICGGFICGGFYLRRLGRWLLVFFFIRLVLFYRSRCWGGRGGFGWLGGRCGA